MEQLKEKMRATWMAGDFGERRKSYWPHSASGARLRP